MNPNIPINSPLAGKDGAPLPAWYRFFSNASKLLIALTQSGTTAQRPTSYLWVGRPYFNTDTPMVEFWDGAAWVTPGGGGGGAPTTATYVTLSPNATLTDERTAAVTSPITLTDGGANNPVTWAFDQSVALNNNARVSVRKNTGAVVGVRRGLNFIEGSNIGLAVADDAGGEEVDVTVSAAVTRAVGVTFDGGGSPITALSKADVRVPYAGTITAVTMLADQLGSMVVDIWKDTYASFPPTVADTITAAAKPTITADDQSVDTTLTGWTIAIAANDCLRFNVDSCATITRCTLILTVTS